MKKLAIIAAVLIATVGQASAVVGHDCPEDSDVCIQESPPPQPGNSFQYLGDTVVHDGMTYVDVGGAGWHVQAADEQGISEIRYLINGNEVHSVDVGGSTTVDRKFTSNNWNLALGTNQYELEIVDTENNTESVNKVLSMNVPGQNDQAKAEGKAFFAGLFSGMFLIGMGGIVAVWYSRRED